MKRRANLSHEDNCMRDMGSATAVAKGSGSLQIDAANPGFGEIPARDFRSEHRRLCLGQFKGGTIESSRIFIDIFADPFQPQLISMSGHLSSELIDWTIISKSYSNATSQTERRGTRKNLLWASAIVPPDYTMRLRASFIDRQCR
jgi:hypothetical protein